MWWSGANAPRSCVPPFLLRRVSAVRVMRNVGVNYLGAVIAQPNPRLARAAAESRREQCSRADLLGPVWGAHRSPSRERASSDDRHIAARVANDWRHPGKTPPRRGLRRGRKKRSAASRSRAAKRGSSAQPAVHVTIAQSSGAFVTSSHPRQSGQTVRKATAREILPASRPRERSRSITRCTAECLDSAKKPVTLLAQGMGFRNMDHPTKRPRSPRGRLLLRAKRAHWGALDAGR